MRAGLLIRGAAASGYVTVAPMPAGSGLAPLADIPDRQRRDGFSQLVVRREYSWLVSRRQAMPVLPRRRDEIGQPVQELKRRELHDAIGSRPRGLPAAAGPDPGGRFVSGQHVADSGCAAVWAADHGESLEREGWPGAVSEKMLKTLKIAGHIAVDQCDPDAQPRGGSRTASAPRSIGSATSCSSTRMTPERSTATTGSTNSTANSAAPTAGAIPSTPTAASPWASSRSLAERQRGHDSARWAASRQRAAVAHFRFFGRSFEPASAAIFSPLAYRPWKRNQSSADSASGTTFLKASGVPRGPFCTS